MSSLEAPSLLLIENELFRQLVAFMFCLVVFSLFSVFLNFLLFFLFFFVERVIFFLLKIRETIFVSSLSRAICYSASFVSGILQYF